MMTGQAIFFRFVPHARAGLYRSLGWQDRGDAPGHHGVYARIMVWLGAEADMREPAPPPWPARPPWEAWRARAVWEDWP